MATIPESEETTGRVEGCARLRSRLGRWIAPLAAPIGLIAALASGAAAWGWAAHGSPRAAFALARGDTVLLSPARADLGALAPGRRTEFSIDVVNLASRPVTIQGTRVSCSCLSVEKMPVDLAPHARRTLRFAVNTPPVDRKLPLHVRAELFLDVTETSPVLEVGGEVVPVRPPAAPSSHP